MDTWKKVGYCGVDSGQIILVDPCYVMADRGAKGKAVAGKDQITYDKMLETTNETNAQEVIFAGIAGNGILVRGFGGDGVYPVYAKIENGMTKEIKIVFS